MNERFSFISPRHLAYVLVHNLILNETRNFEYPSLFCLRYVILDGTHPIKINSVPHALFAADCRLKY